ncbi:MAG: hypothetical protein BJ554DRAFT_1555, partial [Olpidium bornovanus]
MRPQKDPAQVASLHANPRKRPRDPPPSAGSGSSAGDGAGAGDADGDRCRRVELTVPQAICGADAPTEASDAAEAQGRLAWRNCPRSPGTVPVANLTFGPGFPTARRWVGTQMTAEFLFSIFNLQ